MSKPNALVVEDAPEFVALLENLLTQEGFSVTVARTGTRGVSLARELRPDLLLLDVSLPDLDGFEVCRLVREFTDAYVVMVTGRDEEIDRVLGLTVGADDYVTKPFSKRELSARIKAMRRRPRQSLTPTLRDFGDIVVDPTAREVRVGGGVADLTRIEFDILDVLTGSPRHAFSRHQLLELVWGDSEYSDDHMVDVHVGNLRKKIGESATRPKHLKTIRGVGYRFDPA